MVLAFKEWRAELKGSLFKIKIFSDYKNLKYFIIIKYLNRY